MNNPYLVSCPLSRTCKDMQGRESLDCLRLKCPVLSAPSVAMIRLWFGECLSRDWKMGSLQKGFSRWKNLYSGISKISKCSRISRQWSDSPLFSALSGLSSISRISKFSRISTECILFKDPFSDSKSRQALLWCPLLCGSRSLLKL